MFNWSISYVFKTLRMSVAETRIGLIITQISYLWHSQDKRSLESARLAFKWTFGPNVGRKHQVMSLNANSIPGFDEKLAIDTKVLKDKYRIAIR